MFYTYKNDFPYSLSFKTGGGTRKTHHIETLQNPLDQNNDHDPIYINLRPLFWFTSKGRSMFGRPVHMGIKSYWSTPI